MPRMANLYAKNDTIKTRNMMDNIMLFAMFMSVLMAFILARIAPNFAPWFYGDELFALHKYKNQLLLPY